MNNFDIILQLAQDGSSKSIEQLLLLYKPLIDKHSRINGRIDEDLRQLIYLRILIYLKHYH